MLIILRCYRHQIAWTCLELCLSLVLRIQACNAISINCHISTSVVLSMCRQLADRIAMKLDNLLIESCGCSYSGNYNEACLIKFKTCVIIDLFATCQALRRVGGHLQPDFSIQCSDSSSSSMNV